MTLGDFSRQANAYHRARPAYPAELLDQVVLDAKVQPGDAVADFGAGTGIFTRLLVERGFRVSAIEPNPAMRDQNDVPKADWREGTFEASGLESASQSWVTAAQAFHWADPEKSLPEIRRVLKRQGIFTVLWNNRINQESEILAWTENAIRRHVPGFDEAYRNKNWETVLESTGDFVFLAHRSARHEITMSKGRYLDLWRSHNRLNTLAGPEKFALLLGDIETYFDQNGFEEIVVPYRCDAWSAQRRD